MKMLNVRRVNFNLLKVLHALLIEKHVTKAAERLFLSQSALSASLKQLREVFSDQLFIRDGREMLPSPIALEIEPLVNEIMLEMRHLFEKEITFDPATSSREFKIGVTEYTQLIILPHILAEMRKKASNIKISAVHFNKEPEEFKKNNLDISLGVCFSKNIADGINTLPLFEDQAVCIGNPANPIFKKKIKLEEYLNSPHIKWISQSRSIQTIVDEALEKEGLHQNNCLKLADLLPGLISLEKDHNLIATTTERVAKQVCQHLALSYQPIPFPCQPEKTHLLWHKRSQNDPAVQWLINIVKDITNKFSKEIEDCIA